MPATQNSRRHSIPILYTRGTHYDVGFDVGRTFSGLIHSFLQVADDLPEYLQAYSTPEGRKGYDDTLNCVKTNFPQYVRELEGIADGAHVPFHQLFLLHMDNIILSAANRKIQGQATGCSTICVNHKGQELLGHTEDALPGTLNHFYFVSAHIISDKPEGKWGVQEEKFTSLCYAGHLPGYTMNYNHHGLVFSINTLSARELRPGKTPRHFISRALLGAKNFEEALQIIKDPGCGAGDGCSFNMTFLRQEGDRLFYNVEMAPASLKMNESQLNIFKVMPGEVAYHTNKYLRTQIEETNEHMSASSVARLEAFSKYAKPKNVNDLKKMLSDNCHKQYPVFLEGTKTLTATLCVGIFNLTDKTWTLYADRPLDHSPLAVLPLIS